MSSSDRTQWIKASASNGGSNCVELRRISDVVEVRDSKDKAGPTLKFSPAALLAWVDGAGNGDFAQLR